MRSMFMVCSALLLVSAGCATLPVFVPPAGVAVIAHRGASHDAPENTLAAFRLARAMGAGNFRIIMMYILPNCMAPLIVHSTLSVANAILFAATLSFLGLGIQPPYPEWGGMLSAARPYLRNSAYMSVFPGLAIMVTILALNFLGDGLRDALDPKQKR